MKECIPEANLEGQGWQATLFTNLLVLTWEFRYFWKWGNIRKRIHWNRTLRLICTLYIRVSKKFHLHSYTYVLANIWQNGAKFIRKLTPGFKNHVRNLNNFREAVESLKSWNLMGYFCPKNTFLQLEYIQRICLTLLSTT